MFKVIHKETGDVVTVFGHSGLLFLLWDEHEEKWWFDDIANYKPLPEFAKALKRLAEDCGVKTED